MTLKCELTWDVILVGVSQSVFVVRYFFIIKIKLGTVYKYAKRKERKRKESVSKIEKIEKISRDIFFWKK